MTASLKKDELDLIPLDDEYFPVVDDNLDLIPLDFEDQEEPQQSPFEMSNEESPNELQQHEPNFAQDIASSLPVQAGLGTAKFFTFPLDLLKMAMQGEGLGSVDEIEEAYARVGKPFDRDKFIQEVQQAASYVPTQQMGEDIFKEQTGINLEPQGTSGKIARGAGELFALTPGSLVRRGVGAIAGSGTAQGLKEVGVPDIIADIAGAGTAGITAAGKLSPKVLRGEAKEAREIAEKHGLRKFAGMEAEKAPFISPVVSEVAEKGLRSELSETTKKAINDVIEQKLPIKTIRDRGTNLEQAYTQAYEITKKAAQSIPGKVSIDNVRNWIKSEIKRVESKAISPSHADKAALKLLREEQKALGKGNPSAEQLLNQYQAYNFNVKSIYRKPEFTGAENEVKRIYAELNNKLLESTRGIPHLEDMFRFSNKIYQETAKLNQVEGILSKAFKDGYDPKALMKLLEGKRSLPYLERSLGKGSVKDLVDIAKYGQMSEKRVFDHLKQPKTVGDYISKLTPLQLGLLLGKKSVTLPFAIAKAPMNRIQGYLFTRNGTKKSYINFLKAASQGTPAMILKAGKALEQAIKDEFGGEQGLLDLIEMNAQN